LAVKESAELDSEHQPPVEHMAKAVKDIEREIRALSAEERAELMRSLIADLDAPADANVERAWLETSQRRYRELVEGKVKGVSGPLVFDRLRKRLGE
jgi:acyl-CoA reductase-like NAD-dependent aldehyde dehydrogenase